MVSEYSKDINRSHIAPLSIDPSIYLLYFLLKAHNFSPQRFFVQFSSKPKKKIEIPACAFHIVIEMMRINEQKIFHVIILVHVTDLNLWL